MNISIFDTLKFVNHFDQLFSFHFFVIELVAKARFLLAPSSLIFLSLIDGELAHKLFWFTINPFIINQTTLKFFHLLSLFLFLRISIFVIQLLQLLFNLYLPQLDWFLWFLECFHLKIVLTDWSGRWVVMSIVSFIRRFLFGGRAVSLSRSEGVVLF